MTATAFDAAATAHRRVDLHDELSTVNVLAPFAPTFGEQDRHITRAEQPQVTAIRALGRLAITAALACAIAAVWLPDYWIKFVITAAILLLTGAAILGQKPTHTSHLQGLPRRRG